MARFILGGIISDIKGSISGTTFSKHRNSHVARSKAKQPRANSYYRQLNLQVMAQVSSEWRNLSNAQRQDWNDYAVIRNRIKSKSFPVPYSGFQCFQSINYYIFPLTDSYLLAPSGSFGDVEVVEMDIAVDSSHVELQLDRAMDTDDELLLLYISPAVTDSTLNPGSRLKYLPPAPGYTDTPDIGDLYIARFGIIPAVGSSVFIRYAVISRASGWMTSWTLVRQQLIAI